MSQKIKIQGNTLKPETLRISSKSVAKQPTGISKSKVMNSSVKSGVRVSSHKQPTRILPKSSGIRPSGIIDDVISTGMSVGKVLSSVAEGNPAGLLEIPNTVMKVIDTSKNIVRSIQSSDAKEKVVLEDKKDIKSVQDTVILDKLSSVMPVVTTTQLPTSYSTEVSIPEITITRSMSNGKEIDVVRGSYLCAAIAVTGEALFLIN
jgi:hypothetical protein